MVQVDMFGRGFRLQLAITAACSMAFILFGVVEHSKSASGIFTHAHLGYDQGVFSGIVGNEHFLDVVGHPDDTILGIIVAVYNLGCFTGCIGAFTFGEWLGRRRAMWVAMAWIIVRQTRASIERFPKLTLGLGWRFATGVRLLKSTYDRCAFRDWHRHWS